jgi:hypothetical protein
MEEELFSMFNGHKVDLRTPQDLSQYFRDDVLQRRRICMSKTDLVRVHHILDAAHEVLEFSIGKSRQDLDIDRMLNLSLVHLLEIIGKAAVGISPEFRKKYPSMGCHCGNA